MAAPIETIPEQARKIAASGALGRSRSYRRLLEFLVERTAEGRAPKELEIATEVFGKDFDPTQDSTVRVYGHHLRQKIRRFYDAAGGDEPWPLTIPKGEYRVTLVPAAVAELRPATPRGWYAGATAAGVLLAASKYRRPYVSRRALRAGGRVGRRSPS